MRKKYEKVDNEYFNDQLRKGENCYGEPSYGKSFDNLNSEYHAKNVKIV